MMAAITWQALGLFPAAALAGGVVVAAVLALYPPQLRQLPRLWQILLPTLRSLAMLALAAAVLKPILSRPKTVAEQGAVAIIVDRSRSMSVVDGSRSPAQLVALADGLGLLPPGARSASLAKLSAEMQKLGSLFDEIARARSEVEYARLAGRDPQAAQKRLDQALADFSATAIRAAKQASADSPSQTANQLVELSRLSDRSSPGWFTALRTRLLAVSDRAKNVVENEDRNLYAFDESVRNVCDDLARRSRLGLAELALAGGHTGLLAQLDKDLPVRGFALADSIAPLTLASAASLGIDADGLASNLTGGMQAVLDQFRNQPLQAIILFSDGRQPAGSAVSSGLVPSGVPVFTVEVAPPLVRDLAIQDIQAPGGAMVGETITVRVQASSVGLSPTTAPAQATLGEGPPTTQALQVSGGKAQPMQFTFKAEHGGILPIRIALPAQSGEVSVENNQATRWVKVVAQRVHVAALSGSAGWDWRYLRNALARTPWVELSESMLDVEGAHLALTPQQILQQDLLILDDVPAGALSPEQWDAVGRLATERAGSVLLIAGEHLPDEYLESPTLAALLPYPAVGAKAVWRTWPGDTPAFSVAPVPDAADLECLQLDPDPKASLRRWDQLPAFFRYLALPQLKPNARMLLVERDSLRPAGAGKDAAPQPILTESRAGRGRIFFFGMDETWRWRYKVGEKDQDRFWLQLLRHAVEEPYALSAGRMALDAQKIALQPAEPIHVRARLRSDTPTTLPAQLPVQVLQDGKLQRTDTLSAAGGAGSGRYETAVAGLPAGTYQLRLVDPADPENVLLLPLQVAASSEEEMANLAGDAEHLREMASASGGKDLSIEQVGLIPKLLEAARQRQSGTVELPLWDSWYLFLFVVACLSAEWAMRKRFGLA